MSGAEAGFVIGLIGSLISIVDGAKKIYDAAKDAKGQPKEFRQVAARLPLVIEILRNAEAAAPELELDEKKREALEPVLKSCKAKAEKLQEIFQKVIRKDDDKWFNRYKKALHTLGKGDQVECLMEGIQKDTQLLACEKLMGIATDEQVKGLEEGIREMKEIYASAQDDTLGVTQTHNGTGDNIGHSGSGNNYGGNSHHNQNSGDVNYGNDDPKACLKDLRTTDPRVDKERIEQTNGGLLKDSYGWILENSEFLQWHENKQSRLLWIRGDPGKGKTMLLCGIIDKLEEDAGPTFASSNCLLTYFFCQATDSRINSATAVLRGLIYLLADKQPALLKYVREKYDNTGKDLFVDTNAWFALSKIFINILQDPGFESAYVIIDALDECVTDLSLLLQFIDNISSVSPRVKWIISSRNWPKIEEQLNKSNQKFQLRLELNEDSITAAVRMYIEFKVAALAKWKKYNAKLANLVRESLFRNADATFLWVALVLQELEKTDRRKALKLVQKFPPGLDPLYKRMMAQVNESENADLCKRILSIVTAVKRPITLRELVSLDETLHQLDCPDNISEDIEDLEQTIGQCGSFLTIRKSIVYFVHQSAKDFLLQESTSQELFRLRIDEVNYTIFSRSLQVMSRTLRRNIYNLTAPGISIEQVKQPDPDPLAAIRYSCLYWADHLLDSQTKEDINKDFKDNSLIHVFLRQYFLYWLEALSLMKCVADGIVMIKKLETLQLNGSPSLLAFIYDARRFIVYNRSVIERAPLQSYCSALVFSPEKSLVRVEFEKCIPAWIEIKPRVDIYWNTLLQTLEGHSGSVRSVAFSPDGKQVVSGSQDRTVRLWDTVTGTSLQTLKGHSERVVSVAFSPDSKQIVSGSYDNTVRLWDTTGALLQILKGHSDSVTSVAFSPDGKQVASGSHDKTVRLWDTTGALLQTLEGHSNWVKSVAFSPDSKRIISGSHDNTVRLWDTTGALLKTLEGHSNWVKSVAFSPDGKQVVSGSCDQSVRLWDAATGALLQTFKGHSEWVSSVAFSPDGKQVVSTSLDKTVRLWDAAIVPLLQTLEGHSDWIVSVAFSPDGKQVVSGSLDKTARLWDAATSALLQTFKGHLGSVISAVFSPDGKQVASASSDKIVRLWDVVTGALLQILKGHSGSVWSVVFSPDGKQIISGSRDETIRLWDVATGALLQTLTGYSNTVSLVTFSLESKQISTLYVSSHWIEDDTIQILWLNSEDRPTCEAIWKKSLVLGHSSGRVSIFQFKEGSKLVTSI